MRPHVSPRPVRAALVACCLVAVAALAMLAPRDSAAQRLTTVPAPPQLQTLPPLPAPAAAASAASAAGRAAASARPHVVVIEDDDVRIEETRVRGQLQRIVVQSKVPGAKAYEIIVGPGGKDSSQDRGATGQSAWSLFEF